ncbi:hypothetical protein D3C81_1993830 [compost metagenome]
MVSWIAREVTSGKVAVVKASGSTLAVAATVISRLFRPSVTPSVLLVQVLLLPSIAMVSTVLVSAITLPTLTNRE